MAVGPDLSQLSLNQLEELSGRSHRFVKRALREAGVEPVGRTGRARLYPAQAALAAIFAGGAAGDLDPRQERAALDRVRRERQELELERRREELLPRREVLRGMEALNVRTRDRILAVPQRTAHELAIADKPSETHGILDGELRAALYEVADPEAAKKVLREALANEA